MNPIYSKNFIRYQRRLTQVVDIDGIPLGGEYPIRIQSMTNTLTSDAEATVDQIERILGAGADYVRVTVPGRKDVESLKIIRDLLRKKGIQVPLIADIHFNPELAKLSAAIVSKVRINPGNFVDKKNFKTISYSEEEYAQELLAIRKQFKELLDICRDNQTALRIGTNHGSLSDRIMSRFGDTPEGMAESAMEFLRISHEENFKNVVLSMKASNTRIMVYATRLLLSKMESEGMRYPLHLGVTEAGEGEDGRIRSAVGIGTLLADGIGETIRVSLTEDPEAEIPVAKSMIEYVAQWENHPPIADFGANPINSYSYSKRITKNLGIIGGDKVPLVISKLKSLTQVSDLSIIGWKFLASGEWELDELSPDILVISKLEKDIPLPPDKYLMITDPNPAQLKNDRLIPLLSWKEFELQREELRGLSGVEILAGQLDNRKIEILKRRDNTVLILGTDNVNGFADQRSALFRLINEDCQIPVILKRTYHESNKESLQLKAAIDFGGLFIDGLGDGIWIENSAEPEMRDNIEAAFGILQASRVRVSKTEYISCPSCGRTLFDLQATTKKIRERTSHLKGLKIGIMGCIVNGPGEMADADYGYVGAGPGKVNLYKMKEVVRRSIAEEEAVEVLIELIKENGDWVEP